MKDLLIVSNGHGEDTVACRVLDALAKVAPRPLTIDAWPMVGEGEAYAKRTLPLVGARNTLPSGGFATLSLRMMVKDLAAGWIATHLRQFNSARAMRGRYRLILSVGDIVPIAAAVVARTPFLFIGCAKSSYYNPLHAYTGLEKRLLRRHSRLTFPRDRLTVAELERARVPTRYVGNPMMDDLGGAGDDLGLSPSDRCIALLAGSREDAEANALDMLAYAQAWARREAEPLRFVFAVHDGFDFGRFAAALGVGPAQDGWRIVTQTADNKGPGVALCLRGPGEADVRIAKGRFADVLRRSTLAIGMAGTAGEQAIGLGVPLIAVPSAGVQGERYVAMKEVFYGEAAVTLPRDPDRVAATLRDLLDDPARRARMIEAGAERMGGPGASAAIAAEILAAL